MKPSIWWYYIPIAILAVGGTVFGLGPAEMAALPEAAGVALPASSAAMPPADHYASQAKQVSKPSEKF